MPAVASVKPIVPVRSYEPNVISPSSRSRHPLDVQQRFANLNRDVSYLWNVVASIESSQMRVASGSTINCECAIVIGPDGENSGTGT